MLSVLVKEILIFVNIWQSYRQEGGLFHALCVAGHHPAER